MTRRDAKTLLIADDDRDLVSILTIRSRLLGLKVLTASDAFTALSLVRSTMPDLVCLDVGMPGGNGLSVCEMITSDPTFREIPVIVLTGRSDPQTISRCHSMNAYYVEKSTDTWERMEPLIRELLEIPLTTTGSPEQKSGDKGPVDPEPGPVFPNLSALVAETPTDEPITTSADLASDLPEPLVPLKETDALHPAPADSCASAIGSSDVESEEPYFLPDWETSTVDGSGERTPTLLPQLPPAGTADEECETPKRESADLASQEETAPSETEAPSEPSSVWRQLAQAVGRVVGRTEEPEKTLDVSTGSEGSAPPIDVSEAEAQPGMRHDSVRVPVGSMVSLESTPTDVAAVDEQNRHAPLASKFEQETDDQSTGDTTEQPPLAAIDQVWSLVGRSTPVPRPTELSPDHHSRPVPLERPERKSKEKKIDVLHEKTILIGDDDCDLVQMLVLRCTQLGVRVFRSPDAMHALLGAHRVEPDLVILDVHMPGGNGLSVCEMMAGDPALAKIPVIIVTGDPNEEIPRRCQALHAQFLRKGAGLWERLEPRIRESLGLPAAIVPKAVASPRADLPEQERQPRILCIDDDPEISKLLKIRLEPYGVDVIRHLRECKDIGRRSTCGPIW